MDLITCSLVSCVEYLIRKLVFKRFKAIVLWSCLKETRIIAWTDDEQLQCSALLILFWSLFWCIFINPGKNAFYSVNPAINKTSFQSFFLFFSQRAVQRWYTLKFLEKKPRIKNCAIPSILVFFIHELINSQDTPVFCTLSTFVFEITEAKWKQIWFSRRINDIAN